MAVLDKIRVLRCVNSFVLMLSQDVALPVSSVKSTASKGSTDMGFSGPILMQIIGDQERLITDIQNRYTFNVMF